MLLRGVVGCGGGVGCCEEGIFHFCANVSVLRLILLSIVLLQLGDVRVQHLNQSGLGRVNRGQAIGKSATNVIQLYQRLRLLHKQRIDT